MSIALTIVLFLARDEEEQQNRLHEYGLAIVSITEGILQQEPENEGALELHEWFSLSTKGKFRGHADLQEHEHKVRHPRDDDEQDDQGYDDQYHDEHGGYDHYNEY
jgi:hypothetical protein